MKRKDLIQYLESNECEFLREGANHTVYVNRKKRKASTVPRNREVDENLVIPRNSRIEVSGAVQHIIVRGLERRKIFSDDLVLLTSEKKILIFVLCSYHFIFFQHLTKCSSPTFSKPIFSSRQRGSLTGHLA